LFLSMETVIKIKLIRDDMIYYNIDTSQRILNNNLNYGVMFTGSYVQAVISIKFNYGKVIWRDLILQQLFQSISVYK